MNTPTGEKRRVKRSDISAIIPLFNEEDSVRELVAELVDSLESTGLSYEILLVDDGSTDATAKNIRAVMSEWETVHGMFLARNYGQSTAIQAGFDASQGEYVVTLDGDLQNDPSEIKSMLDLMEETEADLVSGWRKNRKDDILRVLISRMANSLISWTTGVKLHDFGCSLKIYRRSLLQHIRIYGELHRFLPVVLAEVGAKIVEKEVMHRPRKFGRSKYGIDRTLRVVLDLLLVRFFQKYMHRPLHFFGSIGLLMLTAGGAIAAYLTFLKYALGEAIGSRPLLLAGVFLMISGIVMISQGLIGEIMVRVLHEPAGRRQYILRDDLAASVERQDD